MATRAAAARRMDDAKKAGQKMSSPSKSAPNRTTVPKKPKGPGLLLPQDYAMAPSPPNTLYRPIEEPIGDMHWKLKAPKGEPWKDWDQAASSVISAKGATRGVRVSAPGAGMPKKSGGGKGMAKSAPKKGAMVPGAPGAMAQAPPEIRRFSVGKGAKGHGWSGVSRPADFARHMDEVDDYYGGLPLDAAGRVMLRPDVRAGEGNIPAHLSNGPIAANTVMEQPQWPAVPDGPVGRFARAGPGARKGGADQASEAELELLSEIASESMESSPPDRKELDALRKQRENAVKGRAAAQQEVEQQRAQMLAMHEKIEFLQISLRDARGHGASAAGVMEQELARAHGLTLTPEGGVADPEPLAITEGGEGAGGGEGEQEQWATPRRGDSSGAGSGGTGGRPGSRGGSAAGGAGSAGSRGGPGGGPALPGKVQSALDELAALEGGLELSLLQPGDEAEGGRAGGAGGGGSRPGSRAGRSSGGAGSSGQGSRLPSRPGSRGGMGSSRGIDLAMVRKLEERVDMSRNIMRKLYRKNVELDKENQLLRAQLDERPPPPADGAGAPAGGAGAGAPAGGAGAAAPGGPGAWVNGGAGAGALAAMPGGGGGGGGGAELPSESPVFVLLQEKDHRIHELADLLEEARARILALERTMAEAAVVKSVTHAPPRTAPGQQGGRPGMVKRSVSMNLSGSLPPGSIVDGLRQAVAESTTHFEKYRQIRSDYRRLLNRRVESVRRATGASNEAKKVVVELRERLTQEVRERETEASMFNSRLYEAEKRQSDWYVERRLLEQKVARLDGEVRERDRLDAQIESCVTALFERMRLLERANQDLTSQLGDIGLVDAHAARVAAVKAAAEEEDGAVGGGVGAPLLTTPEEAAVGQTAVPERGGADVYVHEPAPATPM